jgi:hypothetical protein
MTNQRNLKLESEKQSRFNNRNKVTTTVKKWRQNKHLKLSSLKQKNKKKLKNINFWTHKATKAKKARIKAPRQNRNKPR